MTLHSNCRTRYHNCTKTVFDEMRFKRQLTLLFVFVVVVVTSNDGFVLLGMYDRRNRTHNHFLQKDFVEARRRKHKFHLILPLVVSALLVKSIVFPLAVKAMAVMSSVAVLLSFMSLIISSIVGYAKLAYQSSRVPPPAVKIIYVDKPWHKQAWSPQEASLPIHRTKYITSDPFLFDNEEPNVIDHYHTFVD